MSSPAVAPYVGTYSARTPYLTTDEWLNSPTGVAITDLLDDGTLAQQTQVLADCIERASSWIDELCFQVLAATTDTQYGRYRVDRCGVVKVPVRFKPVLEVAAVSVGESPSRMQPLASLADVTILPTGVVEVPVDALPAGPSPGLYLGPMVGSRPLLQVTYVNGYPNTTLAAAATQGVSSIQVASPLGIYPGTPLTVYDTLQQTEHVTVDQSYVAGSTTVPLAAPLAAAHAAGISVSALPPRVKQAAVLLTTALIQTRGDESIVLAQLPEPRDVQGGPTTAADTIALAMDLLESLRRAV